MVYWKMIKPKKISEGFIWDPIHKELIDVRCNNSKLKKLVKNSVPVGALLTTPFFVSETYQGPEFDRLANMLQLQKAFQDKYGFYPDLHRVASAMMAECTELWEASEGKWWSKKKHTHKERLRELADLFHFILIYMLEEKIASHELYNEYCDKLKENYARQESGTY